MPYFQTNPMIMLSSDTIPWVWEWTNILIPAFGYPIVTHTHNMMLGIRDSHGLDNNFPLFNLLHRVQKTITRVWTKPTSSMRYWVRNYHNWGPGMDPGVFHIWGGLRTMGDGGDDDREVLFLVKNQQTWVFSWSFMIFHGISPATNVVVHLAVTETL